MPRIPTNMLDCVCYMYPSIESARAGADFGGTGFLVALPSRIPGASFLYAVTNWHVACSVGASVVRVNRQDGATDIFPFGPEQWEFDKRYDIAVRSITLDDKVHRYSCISHEAFISPDAIRDRGIGPGDDVFMVGRFVDHDGGPINRPAVRFGNISVMPAPISQPGLGTLVDSYCIDLHSRSGYSGSPVFVYRTPGYDLEKMLDGENPKILLAGTNLLGLLGIHFAQFPEEWELVDARKPPQPQASSVPLIREGKSVKGLSGMTCVLPAAIILEVLNLPRLQAARNAAEEAALAHGLGQQKVPNGR